MPSLQQYQISLTEPSVRNKKPVVRVYAIPAHTELEAYTLFEEEIGSHQFANCRIDIVPLGFLAVPLAGILLEPK